MAVGSIVGFDEAFRDISFTDPCADPSRSNTTVERCHRRPGGVRREAAYDVVSAGDHLVGLRAEAALVVADHQRSTAGDDQSAAVGLRLG